MQATRECIYNLEQKDYVTFLETAEESNGERTLVEVELAPGGGNPLHFHKAFTEEFEVIEGQLNIQRGEKQLVLKAGEKALVPLYVKHRFYNTSDQTTRFRVELRPGHPGFEQTIRIGYRMSGEKVGFIKNLLAISLLLERSDTRFVGAMSLIQPFFGLLAAIARRQGLDKELEAKYGYREA
jgi:quercetin dioxygenase-like cupin family protein